MATSRSKLLSEQSVGQRPNPVSILDLAAEFISHSASLRLLLHERSESCNFWLRVDNLQVQAKVLLFEGHLVPLWSRLFGHHLTGPASVVLILV